MNSDQQLLRYGRHIILPQVGIEGQEKLQSSKVMIIGLGGLGSPVALYLAAAGVGELILCDHDKVDISNLQRQIIHGVASLGRYKVDSAEQRLMDINPDCNLRTIHHPFTGAMLVQENHPLDLVVDCTDNLSSRLLINRACVEQKIPLVSGGAIRMEGQIAIFFNAGDGPCYQCLFTDPNEKRPSCSETGVLATTVGIIGTLQAQEVLKILVGIGKTVDGALLIMDGMQGDWQKMQVTKRRDCPACNV